MASSTVSAQPGAVDDDRRIAYVTAFGETAAPEGWRTNKLQGGIVMDVRSNEIIAGGLAMPHSPRLYGGYLYVLASASEELLRVTPGTGHVDVVAHVPGFIRGLSFHGRHCFIGVSTLRKSHTFGDLPIAGRRIHAGVVVVNLDSGAIEAEVSYQNDLNEVYDVQVLAGKCRPNVLNLPMSEQFRAMVTPEGARWVVDEPVTTDSTKIREARK